MKVEVDATKVTALLDRQIKATPKKIDRALSMTAQQGTNVIFLPAESTQECMKSISQER